MSSEQKPSLENSSADTNAHQEPATSSPQSIDRRPPRWLILFKPKVGISLAIFLVLAAIPLAIRSWRISSLPQIEKPFDIEEFCAVTIPDEENASIEYRKAFKLLVPFPGKREDWNSYRALAHGNWDDAPSAYSSWIKANNPAFNLWLKGTAKPSAMFTPRRDIDYFQVDYISDARSLVRIAMLRAGLHLRDGNTVKAWQTLHAAFRFSRHLGQNGIHTERTAAVGLVAIISSVVQTWSHHVNTSAADIDNAISILSRDFRTMTSPFSRTLKHEYLAARQCLKTLRQNSWVFTNEPMIDSAVLFVLGEPEYSERLLDLVLANQLSECDTNPLSKTKIVPSDSRLFDISAVPGKRISGVELAGLLKPVSAIELEAGFVSIEHSIVALNLEKTYLNLMIAGLSIEAYVRRNGRFPASLDEFSTLSDAGQFADPFHPRSENLTYRAGREFAVVYSLGVDGFDDGHPPTPKSDKQQNSWSQLENSDQRFEGYRIPLWRPATAESKAEQETSAPPDHVQD